MTTWISEDRENAMKKEDDEYSGGIPIPFLGWVQQQDKDDTEEMLRHQLHIITEQLQVLQADNQQLKAKLRAYGENE